MEEFNKWWDKYDGVVAIMSLIFSTFLAVYYYFKGKTRKQVNVHSMNLTVFDHGIKEHSNELRVSFGDKVIENLCASYWIFFNSGNTTVFFKDVATKDKLRFEKMEDCDIYSINIVEEVNKANNFQIRKSEHDYELTFDYIDAMEGVCVKVLHSGKVGDEINLVGSIIGHGNLGVYKMGKISFWEWTKLSSKDGGLGIFIVFICAALGSIVFMIIDYKDYWSYISFTLAIIFIYLLRPVKRIPKKLLKYYNL